MSSPVLTEATRFDVREIPCRIKHGQIFQRWLDLPVGEYFVLVNDHDPVPLYYQFAAQFPEAFTWTYLLRGPDEFQVQITKVAPVTAEGPLPQGCGGHDDVPTTHSVGEFEELDARGLEPPEPLVRILAALEALAPGRRLRAITDREPCHLFGEAEARGFRHDSREQPNGSWVTVLERA